MAELAYFHIQLICNIKIIIYFLINDKIVVDE